MPVQHGMTTLFTLLLATFLGATLFFTMEMVWTVTRFYVFGTGPIAAAWSEAEEAELQRRLTRYAEIASEHIEPIEEEEDDEFTRHYGEWMAA